jgi:hypothetical protein
MTIVGDAHIHISMVSDETYRSDVEKLVNGILFTKTGQAIDTLIRQHGSVWIQPSDSQDAQAETTGVSEATAWINFYPNTGDQNANVTLKLGTMGTMKVKTIRLSPGFAPDEILCHELVHAARILGNDDGPQNEEEFFAVLVANIYISEKGKSYSDLRYHYDALSRPMDEKDVEPFIFLLQWDGQKKEEHLLLIEKFCRQHPTIAPMIAKAPAKFNPIRDFYAYGKPAPGYSFQDSLVDLGSESPELPIRTTQNESYVLITDEYLIRLLEPRFRADDVEGFGQRAKKLAQVFAGLSLIEAVPLLVRLVSRRPGDEVAKLFHNHLATATRIKLINILRSRISN